MPCFRGLFLVAILLLAPVMARAQAHFRFGTLPEPQGDCIPPAQRALVEENIARYHARYGFPIVRAFDEGPPPYPFHPQAGNLWEDLFRDRKSTRLNSSHSQISYAVFCLKKKK